MPKKALTGLVLVLVLFLLTACNQAIDSGSTLISVNITKDGCRPISWRVPAGQTITIKITSQVAEDYTWTMMARPVTLPLDGNDAANIYFAHQVAPDQSETTQFTSPNAPGEYDVICSPIRHTEEDLVGRITVVRP
jgi:plastocyanin